MQIERVIVGDLRENCYIISQNKDCLIVDPGAEFHKIKDKVGDRKVVGVLLTHHHFDHVGAIKEVLEYYQTKLYDFHVLQEKEYTIGPFQFQVIYNPGHSKDSISFFFEKEKVMFVGDFIFLENIGRCDLEGGSFIEMQKSIENLKRYSIDITLYPGHGEKPTLEHEKRNNSFF